MLKLDRVAEAMVVTQPFACLVASDVLSKDDLARIEADFPEITQSGSLPVCKLSCGPQFERLILELKGREIEEVLEKKFGVDLSDKPLLVSACDRREPRDGGCQTDPSDKILTCLLTLDDTGSECGRPLRQFGSGGGSADLLTEMPPEGGTLIAFRRADDAWQEQLPFEGRRRCVMFNWVRSDAALMKGASRGRPALRARRPAAFA